MIMLILTILALLAVLAAVMITDPCALDILVTNAGCYDCLSEKEKLAVRVAYKCQALKALGDLSSCDPNDLLSNSACIACLPDGRLDSLETYLAAMMASNAGADVTPTDVTAAKAAINCLVCKSEHELRAIEVQLDCKLTGEISPPIIL